MADLPKLGTTSLDRGWHEGLGIDTYLADPAVSASRLWKLHETTPAHLLAALETPDVVTDPKALGSITHSAVYEPDVFDDRYIVIGQCEALRGDETRCKNPGTAARGRDAHLRPGRRTLHGRGLGGHAEGSEDPERLPPLPTWLDVLLRRRHALEPDHPEPRAGSSS